MQINLRQSLRNFDWILIILILVLLSVGLAGIYSVDLSRETNLGFFSTQVLASVIGLFLLLFAGLFHSSFYQSSAKLVYIIALILLILVLIFGKTINGTTGWFIFAGHSFQPVEFAKIALILILGWWIQLYGRRFEKWQFVFTSGFITLGLAGLIILQPDLGSALVLFGIWFGMLFLTGTRKRYILGLLLIFLIVFLFSWFFLFADYQKGRVLTFIDPSRDPLSSGYNVTQSIIAIGSGQLFGRGLGFGSQSQLHFLPEAQTDFIFSVIAEELGFVGVLTVLVLYFLILWRLLRIAFRAKSEFATYVVLGIILLFFIQILINLGTVSGFMPVVGITLPFLSYGGSSLIIDLILIGIAMSTQQDLTN